MDWKRLRRQLITQSKGSLLLLVLLLVNVALRAQVIPLDGSGGNQGICAWNVTSNSGPEPKASGHYITWQSCAAYAYYYMATYDHIAGGTGEGYSFGTPNSGWNNTSTALSNNGLSWSDITYRSAVMTLKSTSYAGGIEHRTYRGGTCEFLLDGEVIFSGPQPDVSMTINYHNLGSCADDVVTGYTSYFIPSDATDANSSQAAQDVAAALLLDIGQNGIRFYYAGMESATHIAFSGQGRYGGRWHGTGEVQRGAAALPNVVVQNKVNIRGGVLDLTIQDTAIIDSQLFVSGEIEVQSGGVFKIDDVLLTTGQIDIQSGGEIIISDGNGLRTDTTLGSVVLQNAGQISFNPGAILTFQSEDAQETGTGTPDSIGTVKIRSGGDVTFTGGNMYIRDSILLDSGDLVIGDGNYIVLDTNTGVTGAGANSYLRIVGSGFVRRTMGKQAIKTDVGFNPHLPVTIECNDCNGEETFDISVRDLVYENPETQTTEITTNVVTNTWKIVTTANRDVTLTFQWNGSDEVSLGSSVFVAYWKEGENTSWTEGTLQSKGGSDPYTATISLNEMNGSYHFGIGNSSSPLPVELTSFTAKEINNVARLEWITANEVANERFEIQRSLNGHEFTTIAEVAGQGTKMSPSLYSYTDEGFGQLSGEVIFYRLKQVDFSGDFAYSKVVTLASHSIRDQVSVYPTLLQNELILKVHDDRIVEWLIMNDLGQVVMKGVANGQTGIETSELKQGVYLLKVATGQDYELYRLVKPE